MDAAKALERLVQNRLKPLPLGPLPTEIRPAGIADGYRLQDLLHGRLTALGFGPLGGHKIGCTTPVMQRFLNIDSPCAGGVFARTAHHRLARLRHGDFHRLGVECEIAVRLGRDLPATAAPFSTARVADAVAAVMVAIELVDDRYQDYRTMDVATLVADDFFNAGCVLGEPVEAWRELDLKTLAGRMTVNGEIVGQGRGSDILGDPLAALGWLAQSFAARGHDLRAGEFVLLGSIVQTRWIAAGDRVTAEIDGLGQVQVELQ